MASEHDNLSSLNSTVFDGPDFLPVSMDVWPLPIPHNGADPPTPAQNESAQSLPAAALNILEARLKVVGSPQIQHAASRRRKRNGTYQCPFSNAGTAGCNATFTTRHNLRYHINAHLGLKPYKCVKCPYAAASPATKKRHQTTCEGTVSKYGTAKEQNDMVPEEDYPSSQELADIKLTDQFHLSFGEDKFSHPGSDIWPFHVPTNGAADLSRFPPIATLSSRSSIGSSLVRPYVINFEAVDDDILTAELSRIRQTADQRQKNDGIRSNL